MHSRCPICLAFFTPDDVAALRCGHTFHRACILQWLNQSPTCSTCRYPIRGPRDVIGHLHFDFGHAGPITDNCKETAEKLDKCREDIKAMKKETFDKLNVESTAMTQFHAEAMKSIENIKARNSELTSIKRRYQAVRLDNIRMRRTIIDLQANQKPRKVFPLPPPPSRHIQRPQAASASGNRGAGSHVIKNPTSAVTKTTVAPKKTNVGHGGDMKIQGTNQVRVPQRPILIAQRPNAAQLPNATRRRSAKVMAAQQILSKAKKTVGNHGNA